LRCIPVYVQSGRVKQAVKTQQPIKRRPLEWRLIADTAIALADEVGLERLSLRGVAERLNVTPMALYKQVPRSITPVPIVKTFGHVASRT
jgi:hypothetical protein